MNLLIIAGELRCHGVEEQGQVLCVIVVIIGRVRYIGETLINIIYDSIMTLDDFIIMTMNFLKSPGNSEVQ